MGHASYAMHQSRGDRQRGLVLLDKLDKLDEHFSADKAVGVWINWSLNPVSPPVSPFGKGALTLAMSGG